MISPCMGCVPPQRFPGCHQHCEKYIAWKDEHNIIKQRKEKFERELDLQYGLKPKKRRR